MTASGFSEATAFTQTSCGLSEWVASHGFMYDIAYPSFINYVEIESLIEEVFVNDSYRLSSITQQGDVWVDVGCHVGLFSIAAMQQGAQVGVVVDIDLDALWTARMNTTSFRLQSISRGLQDEGAFEPFAVSESVTHTDQLVELARLASSHFFPDKKRTCLKLDIQGSEYSVFEDTNFSLLKDYYDLIVFEYHRDDIDQMALLLENAGWHINKMQKHIDTLLSIETYLVWATSG